MTTVLDRLREALAPDYVVERELASGGMGVVFLGRDVALDRRVAIKIIKPELATAAAAERFIREARILASLNHPNVIPVHRAGESRGLFYYVMEYLEAETMADRLARGALPAAEAVAVARDVLSALEAAHGRGVVHRDVKPANIFLLKGRAVLADFGIAKDTAATGPGLTGDGRVVGSPGYMSPEQMAGGHIGAATDLYAVGLVLYEALTGESWPLLIELSSADWSRVPPGLVPVLRRALAWRAADRWHNAAAFRRSLSPARARRWSRASWAAAALVVVAAALTVDHLVRPPPSGVSTLRIRVRPFALQGPKAPARLGDSLAAVLVQSLGGSHDFTVVVDRGAAQPQGAVLTLSGTGEAARDGTLRLALASDTTEGIGGPLHADARPRRRVAHARGRLAGVPAAGPALEPPRREARRQPADPRAPAHRARAGRLDRRRPPLRARAVERRIRRLHGSDRGGFHLPPLPGPAHRRRAVARQGPEQRADRALSSRPRLLPPALPAHHRGELRAARAACAAAGRRGHGVQRLRARVVREGRRDVPPRAAGGVPAARRAGGDGARDRIVARFRAGVGAPRLDRDRRG